MSVTTMLNKVDQDFASARDKAYAAVSSLNVLASSSAYGNYSAGELFAENSSIPIERITVADDMIDTVLELADSLAGLTFNPPKAIDDFHMLKTKVWSDSFANQIENSLSNYLSTLGVPAVEFQSAIFNESVERNLQTLNDLLDLAEAKTGARGFTYPNSMTTILKLDAQQKWQFDRNQINRDTTKLVTEWARQNYQFAIEKGITFEQFHADFTYKYCTAFVDIYKNLVMASIERFKAELSKAVEPIKAYLEAAKLPVEIAKANADIDKINAELRANDNTRKIDEAIKKFDINSRQYVQVFSEQIKALTAVASDTANLVQAASRSVIGIQK